MASDDSSGPRPAAPIVIRIKLRYDDVEAMVQRFATNVGKSGLFLPTKSIQPIGAEIKFELRLADDTPVLVGLGRVKAATPPDPNNPKATFGMAIELMRVTPQSRALILRMLEQRRAMGLPELGLPAAADIDAARRAEAATAVTRDSLSGPLPLPAAPREAPPAPAPPPGPGDALLTSPRRTTGPMAVAQVVAVTPLAPEPPRRKRMAVGEVIDSASGPIASVAVAVPGLDGDVDLAAAIVRARALAGGLLDAELAALSEVAAVPLESSIEAASAALARQFGGSAVRRDRSARWTPPTATATAPTTTLPDTTRPPPAVIAQADDQAPSHGHDQAREGRSDEIPGAQPAAPAVDPARPRASSPEHHEVEPGQIADEIHQLDELDLEDVEHTEMAEVPSDLGAFAARGAPGEPPVVDPALLAARLEAQLADAEVEADADDLGLAREPAEDEPPEPPPDGSLEEVEEFEILAEADAADADLLAANGEQEASSGHIMLDRPRSMDRRSSEFDFAARLDLGEHSDIYVALSPNELVTQHALDSLHDGFEDRHAHDGLHGIVKDGSQLPDAYPGSAGQALAAFDTGDESLDPTGNEPFEDTGTKPLADPDGPSDHEPHRSVQPIFDPEPSSTFTLAGTLTESGELDFPPAAPEPIGASWPPRNPPAASPEEPVLLRRAPLPSALHDAPMEEHELEHALEALDIELEDLSIPQAIPQAIAQAIPQAAPRRPYPQQTSKSGPTQTLRPISPTPSQPRVRARPTSDDGVEIEFDDDDDDDG